MVKLNFTKLKNKLKYWLNTASKSFGLADLFDTTDMNPVTILSFMQDDDSKMALNLLRHIDMFRENEYEFFQIRIQLENCEFINDNKSLFRLLVNCICVMGIIEGKLNQGKNFHINNLSFNELESLLNDKLRNNIYYRGQTNFEWGICPSIFRNYIFSKTLTLDGELFDIYKLYQKYYNCNLIIKYNETIANKKIMTPLEMNYEFIAYMQHALSYSPLIDITKRIEIGLQYALGNKSSINDFFGKNAALYSFSIPFDFYLKNTEVDSFFQNEFKVNILNKKIKPGTIMYVEDCKGNLKKVDFRTIRRIINELRPDFKVVEFATNDRMRYQNGKFIIFYNYTLVNGRILFSLNQHLDVRQYKILVKSKKELYNMINKHYPQYNMEYLLNPYLYFNK